MWLFQEGERVSSDRLFRVRDKQPFSSESKASTSDTLKVDEVVPSVNDTVEVGDICVFTNGKQI